MISVFERLEIMSKDFEETTFKIIAKKILENIKQGNFYNQEELANQTFVSISTLTKFSKKLGFSGYREFIFTLKSEWAKFDWDNTKKIDTRKIFESIQSWIYKNEVFIDNLANSIKKVDFVNIYSSQQAFDCAKYFANLLVDYGKDVLLLNNEFRFKPKKGPKNSLTLVILTGRDNDTLINNLEREFNQETQNFLIVSEKQIEKLNHNFNERIVVDYSLDNSRISSRIIALNMLFFTIFNKF